MLYDFTERGNFNAYALLYQPPFGGSLGYWCLGLYGICGVVPDGELLEVSVGPTLTKILSGLQVIGAVGSAIPEPWSLALIASGLAVLGAVARRKLG